MVDKAERDVVIVWGSEWLREGVREWVSECEWGSKRMSVWVWVREWMSESVTSIIIENWASKILKLIWSQYNIQQNRYYWNKVTIYWQFFHQLKTKKRHGKFTDKWLEIDFA